MILFLVTYYSSNQYLIIHHD